MNVNYGLLRIEMLQLWRILLCIIQRVRHGVGMVFKHFRYDLFVQTKYFM